MARIVMWNLVTLDGFFEGPTSWDLGWHDIVWGDELERFSIEQLSTADMLLFGRRTYEGMANYWPSATGEVADLMNAIPKIVFSRTLEQAAWNNSRVARDAEDEVSRLRQRPGKDSFVIGSADLCASLTRRGLIDEYRLGVTPVVLGAGNPLFKSNPKTLKLKLVETRPLRSGCVILRYQPEA